jgi:O-antigen/teichoic acid export membrane protein
LGAEELGYYALAFRIPEIAILEIFGHLQAILFPYFARLKDSPQDEDAEDVARFRAAYTQALRICALLAFPLGFGMAALAQQLVLVLYGHNWEPSIVPLALVAVWTSFAAVGGQPSTAYKALGRARLLTVMALVDVGLTIPTLWFAAPFGITAVAGALVMVKVMYLAIQAVLVKRVIGIRVLTQAVPILRGVVAASLMAAIVYPVGQAFPPLVALALGIPTGAVVYLAILRLFFRNDLRFLLYRVRRRRRATLGAATEPSPLGATVVPATGRRGAGSTCGASESRCPEARRATGGSISPARKRTGRARASSADGARLATG